MNVHHLSSSGGQISDHLQTVPELKVARVHTVLMKIYSVIILYIIWGRICACLVHLYINQTIFPLQGNRRQLLRKPKSFSSLTSRACRETHCEEASGEKLQSTASQNRLSGLCLFFWIRSEKGALSFLLWVVADWWWHPKSETYFPQLQSCHILNILHTVLHAHWEQTVDWLFFFPCLTLEHRFWAWF